MKNQHVFGDNLDILRDHIADESVDLVYLDPPFSSNRDYNVVFSGENTSMNTTPVVYVMCGFIGAGKTTFAKKLEEKTGAVRITKDEWLIRLIGNDPAIEGFEELDHRVCELSRDVAFQLVEKGIDVILDEGFWTREQRVELGKRIHAIGANEVLYYLDTPIEAIRERVVGRNSNLTKDSFKISRSMLDNYLKFWQPPGGDENYVLVSRDEIRHINS